MLLQRCLHKQMLLGYVVVLLLLFQQLPTGISTYAQDLTPIPERYNAGLAPDELVYWRPGGFWVFSRVTLRDRLLYPYVVPKLSHLSSSTALDRASSRIYMLEIEGGQYELNTQ